MLDLVLGVLGFAMVLPFGVPILILLFGIPYALIRGSLQSSDEALPDDQYPMKVVVPRSRR